jgi:hypothetical protein
VLLWCSCFSAPANADKAQTQSKSRERARDVDAKAAGTNGDLAALDVGGDPGFLAADEQRFESLLENLVGEKIGLRQGPAGALRSKCLERGFIGND